MLLKRAAFTGMRGRRAPFNGMRGKRGEEDLGVKEVNQNHSRLSLFLTEITKKKKKNYHSFKIVTAFSYFLLHHFSQTKIPYR